MKKNNNIQQFVIAIVTVVAIIAIVGGSTFAYFQWTTNDEQRTNVNVTIAAGGIKMTITQENGKLETAGLRPVADCTKSYSYIDALVEIENTTGTLAVPSFKLKGKVTTAQGTLASTDLQHIHYAVVNLGAVSTTSYTTFNDNAASCSSPATVTGGGMFTNNASTTATGTFADVSTSGGWSDMPTGDATNYLARYYQSGVSDGITFIGKKAGEGLVKNANGQPNEKLKNFTWNVFRVYVWIDETYTYTNVGNTVSDPLQNATIWLQWSGSSIVEQVAD